MKKLNDFLKESILDSNSSKIFGGFKDITSEIKNDNKEVLYTDIHHDNDDDGKWSSGDSFELTMV
ncbi:hypothetical protein [Polaribacter sp. IC073]|uniref:hypothetical protein n=1 Tax=Polaribacter sp. IC073 TaxID=2508540 RepID=UPI0011BFC9E1|nr:hypothetical protein [Polaribacter sp. IC073]TXD49760.1 hypothetical protein ES045_00825 [Polaribacter sp. IC073]